MKKNGEGSKTISCFSKGQKGFFRTLEGVEAHEGEMPEMEEFAEFWGGIWEREERTPNMPWMEEISRQLNEKVNQVNKFNITFEKVKKEEAKRKGWTAPGIDRIQNYWWKTVEPAQNVLARAFTKIRKDNTKYQLGGLEDVKNYHSITCLNTSYKIMTGVVAKYMREHTMEIEIWDKGLLRAVEGVLGTVDQLIIDQCIMEEGKQYHRNLAVTFYNYKKVYNKVHHD